MSENTAIEWATHTQNFWTGCEHVSPACAHCYAEAWAKRAGRDFAIRQRTTPANWRKPLKWQAQAAEFRSQHGHRQRVFTNSLADFFDNKVAQGWRDDAYATIRATPDLDWLILTKRIGNAKRMLPADWGRGFPNVWLGATVVNQEEADRDIPKLLETPAAVRFLSCEPLLGPIDLRLMPRSYGFPRHITSAGHAVGLPQGLHWVIAGGESGAGARPMHPQWPKSLRDQCAAAGVAYLFKQWGEWAPPEETLMPSVSDFAKLGNSIRFHRFDGGTHVERLGKKLCGRHLDGRTWDEFPGPLQHERRHRTTNNSTE